MVGEAGRIGTSLIPSAFIKKSGRVELLSMDAWDALLDAVEQD
jgi:hypothetical protein